MRFLSTVSLAVSLLAHALLGCCAHHAHAGHDEAAMHEQGHQAPGDHGDHGDEGEGHQPCDEGTCAFASGMPRVVIDSPLAAADFAAGHHLTSAEASGVNFAVADRCERPGGPELCILHQRLLI
jgi:hypothetical protein